MTDWLGFARGFYSRFLLRSWEVYRAVPAGYWSFILGGFFPNGIMEVAKKNVPLQQHICQLQQPGLMEVTPGATLLSLPATVRAEIGTKDSVVSGCSSCQEEGQASHSTINLSP